ncbi:MAG: hypothetical protein ABEJ70_02695 [Halobacteriaceae archaeon]
MTRYKPVPDPPADLEAVAAAHRAVPLVPGSVEDCCARLVARTAVPSRDEARRWLTFLEALGLASETGSGYVRTDAEIDRDALARAFRDRVFAAREVLDALAAAGEPLTPDEAFERVADVVPTWERQRRGDWRADWTDRVTALLGWAALLGLVERTDAGYVPAAD